MYRVDKFSSHLNQLSVLHLTDNRFIVTNSVAHTEKMCSICFSIFGESKQEDLCISILKISGLIIDVLLSGNNVNTDTDLYSRIQINMN